MNEDRVRELESWAHGSREGLTTSECVLLDAIAEVCQEVRRLWGDHQSTRVELTRLEARVLELEDALGRDRRALEAAELELTLGGPDSTGRARDLLADRLAALDSLGEAPEPPRTNDKPDLPGLTD